MRRGVAFAALLLSPGTAARADAPPVPLPPVEVDCVGSGPARVCARIDRRAGLLTVFRPATRTLLWQARSAPPAVTLRPDGRLLAEEYRPGGLVELDDGPATLLLVLRSPRGIVARVTIADIARRPQDLPRTVSHRLWSEVRLFDRDGSFVIDLPDGRHLRVAESGRKTMEPSDGRPGFCRYAEKTSEGPCAPLSGRATAGGVGGRSTLPLARYW